MIWDYLTVASLLSGFSVTALMFRVQREIEVQKDQTSDSWIACADFLILATIFLSLIFVVLPLVFFSPPAPKLIIHFARSCCSASAVLLAGYPAAILDHYGILPFFERKAPPVQAAPIEKWIVLASFVFSALALIGTFCLGR
jgi:hypothetical protein